jgi:hypothetical protein
MTKLLADNKELITSIMRNSAEVLEGGLKNAGFNFGYVIAVLNLDELEQTFQTNIHRDYIAACFRQLADKYEEKTASELTRIDISEDKDE